MSEILRVNDLKTHYRISKGFSLKDKGSIKAVDGVSFYVNEGETFGLVGESGCGKTTLGKAILGLVPTTAGNVEFMGRNITGMSRDEMREVRRNLQVIFQDPYGCLDPRKTVEQIIAEPLVVHKIGGKKERQDKVRELMDVVGLSPAHIYRYPHEFSGGQRQRIGIARALILNPKLIICDEPVSALDVSIQSQVLNLLNDLQDKYGLTYIFIAHGLPVVKYISNRIGVMYLGKMVEMSDSEELYAKPLHPYTQALMSAIPIPDPTHEKEQIILEGEIPSPLNPPSGCHFHTRCRFAEPKCAQEEPPFIEYEKGHYVACWRCMK
ncbi:MAG: dipeptide ABC transporter ATP-binding protein [Ruminococcaceae bacterium]|nr:dipeptide ABC transporter ATP-binding protein [Oscillospiraceae bacterium]